MTLGGSQLVPFCQRLLNVVFSRFQSFIMKSNNQFERKKGVSCSFAIRTVRGVVGYIVSKGSTAISAPSKFLRRLIQSNITLSC